MLKTLTLSTPPKQQSLLNLEKEIIATQPEKVEGKGADIAGPVIPSQSDPWKTLKIKLNAFQTRAPLFAMAYEGSGGDPQKMVESAKQLNAFHQKTASIIAKELWQGEPPAAALAVVGRSISESMQDIWKGNNPGEKLSPKRVAGMYMDFMPEIETSIDKVFTDESHVPLPTLTEASVGVKMVAKLTGTVGSQPEPLQELYLNKESISSLTGLLTNDITSKSQEVSKAITVHKNMPPQDPFQQDIAYQSTLKTFGRIYEQSLQIAFTEISNTISSYKNKSNEEKRKYLAGIANEPHGQLYQKASGIAERITSAVYSIGQTQNTSPAPSEESPSMRM